MLGRSQGLEFGWEVGDADDRSGVKWIYQGKGDWPVAIERMFRLGAAIDFKTCILRRV